MQYSGKQFFELLLDFGQSHSPTRFSREGHSCSVIDIGTNRAELIIDIEISDPVSDHCMVTAPTIMHRALPKSTKQNKNYTKIFYDFWNVDLHEVRLDLMKAMQGTENIDCALAVWPWQNMIMAK